MYNPFMQNFLYLMLNKPFGFVCSKCSDRRHTVYEILKPENCICELPEPVSFENVNPVGRLDAETTGLLLMTNDGMFNHNMTIPENHIFKTYKVELENPVNVNLQKIYCQKAKSGLLLPAEKKAGEYFAKNAEIKWLDEKNCTIKIEEGKFHQVRRTFTALENKVTKLERIKIGNLELPQTLPPGKFKILSPAEMEKLILVNKTRI